MAGKFVISKTRDGNFTFVLRAGNGEVILSSQTYKRRANAKAGTESVRKNAASDARFERKSSVRGDPFFTLVATNGQVIGRSEMYSSARACENGIASVRKNAPTAALEDASI